MDDSRCLIQDDYGRMAGGWQSSSFRKNWCGELSELPICGREARRGYPHEWELSTEVPESMDACSELLG